MCMYMYYNILLQYIQETKLYINIMTTIIKLSIASAVHNYVQHVCVQVHYYGTHVHHLNYTYCVCMCMVNRCYMCVHVCVCVCVCVYVTAALTSMDMSWMTVIPLAFLHYYVYNFGGDSNTWKLYKFLGDTTTLIMQAVIRECILLYIDSLATDSQLTSNVSSTNSSNHV